MGGAEMRYADARRKIWRQRKCGQKFDFNAGCYVQRIVVLSGEEARESALIVESGQEWDLDIEACARHAEEAVRKIQLITERGIEAEIIGRWKLARYLPCEFVLLSKGIHPNEKHGAQQSGG